MQDLANIIQPVTLEQFNNMGTHTIPLPKLSNKSKIREAIINFFAIMYKSSTQLDGKFDFKSDDVVNYVKRSAKIDSIYPDTILRYMRELKDEDKVINFECVRKDKRTFKALKPVNPEAKLV